MRIGSASGIRAVLLSGIAAVGLGGCGSTEAYRYYSTPFVPQTVTLVNTVTGEQLWTVDVPAGRELKITFRDSPSRANSAGMDEMTWSIGPRGRPTEGPKSTMMVPGPESRRFDVTHREGPEAVEVEAPR